MSVTPMTGPRSLFRSATGFIVLAVLLGTKAPSADTASDLLPPANRLSPLPVAAVKIHDTFWAPRQEVNRTRTLDHVLQQIEGTGGLRNFDIAAGKVTGKFGGPFWADSDLYKWIEGASWTLATHPDPALDAKLDGIIARIAAAQQPDGYLDTFVQINVPDLRFKNFAFFHEDFSSGHLFEAAVAHYQATGKKTLLTVATRLADLFDREFGPGKKDYIPGHEGIELALVKLSRATGEKRYLDLAEAMIDRRGQKPSIFERQFRELDPNRTVDFLGKPLRIGEWDERFYLKDPKKFDTRYAQDHLPVREQKEAVGHAVRAMFLYCGMADLVYEKSDARLWDSSKALATSATLHRDVRHRRHRTVGTQRRVYRGLRSAERDRLPGDLCLGGDGPLEPPAVQSDRRREIHRRDGAVACTTPSPLVSRSAAISSATSRRSPAAATSSARRGSVCRAVRRRSRASCRRSVRYIYSRSADGLWVNLFIASDATAPLDTGQVTVRQSTNYPWDGDVKIAVEPDAPREFTLHVRLPGWASTPVVQVNGAAVTPEISRGYAVIRRQWKKGDTVQVSLPMEVQRLAGHPKVLPTQGKVAVRRGPLIYSFEQADNRVALDTVVLPQNATFKTQFDPDLAGGVVKLTTEGLTHKSADWTGRLYQPLDVSPATPVTLTAVPYAVWGNRGLGTDDRVDRFVDARLRAAALRASSPHVNWIPSRPFA